MSVIWVILILGILIVTLYLDLRILIVRTILDMRMEFMGAIKNLQDYLKELAEHKKLGLNSEVLEIKSGNQYFLFLKPSSTEESESYSDSYVQEIVKYFRKNDAEIMVVIDE